MLEKIEVGDLLYSPYDNLIGWIYSEVDSIDSFMVEWQDGRKIMMTRVVAQGYKRSIKRLTR